MAAKKFLTEKDVDYLEKRFREVFVTKDEFTAYRSDLLNRLDEILGEIKASREEQTVMSHQVSDHEVRISSLEGTPSA
jgi:hypothetical protein